MKKHFKKCQDEKCKKLAYYGYTEAMYCREHKIGTMFSIKHKRCEDFFCSRRAIYNYKGLEPRFCFHHKTDKEMINTWEPVCTTDKCLRAARYGDKLLNVLCKCPEHKEEGMIYLYYRQCNEVDCYKKAIYAVPTAKVAEYCFEHSDRSMINYHNLRCVIYRCPNKPEYGLPDHIKPTKCFFHHNSKKEVIVEDLGKRRTCIHEGCPIFPYYNFHGLQNDYCIEHKTPEMENVFSMKCDNEECENLAWYGWPGLAKTKCGIHAVVGMRSKRGKIIV